MKKEAYKQYIREVDNWLHRGRRLLLETCLDLYLPGIKVKGKHFQILEIGAGYGKNIAVLSKFGEVDAIEIEPMALEILNKDLSVRHLFSDKVPFSLDHTYDVICAMDFLEHVENDQQVYTWMVEHLNYGGILFLTVPAYQCLFSYHDFAVCHYRRYRLKQLVTLNSDRLLILKKGYFNSFLFPIAAVSRVLGRLSMHINESQKKQSSTVPLFLDRLFFYILKKETSFIKRYPLFPFGLTAFVLFNKYKSTNSPDIKTGVIHSDDKLK
jgi:SAM-dependent methyltransferase